MFVLISAGIAPGIALLSYFYLRDQYEAEPIGMVIRSFIFGALLVFPVMVIQYAFIEEGLIVTAFSEAFLLSGLLEEFLKWFILFYTVYQHAHFNEHYDGIVYAVATSLGFASIENIFYLLASGIDDAIGRALLPVSSHALYGVVMGYYFGRGKFIENKSKVKFLIFSLIVPVLLHGTYDYILIKITQKWFYVMIPFMIFLWWLGLRKVKLANKRQTELLMKNNQIPTSEQ
ncbi:glutamic-type intramembrane protease PrsW [Bacillus taeanensis]|uniref:Protease PrsW n=1 Tax=Bacillus taeanensis TaxID=273032 RepID=A0A366XXL5_9BACI|nr:glutamic-type intramembrane protease PrsW [Bacillus taeanensis]RBW70308.1 PrsW family intramembrane metalloprotease [Bacillus taeanensis]